MSFLRAVRKGLWQRARQIANSLEEVRPFRTIWQRGGDLEKPLRVVQEQALEEAKRQFVDELRQEQSNDGVHEDGTGEDQPAECEREETHFRASRRGRVMAKLVRLKPGATTAIRTMQDAR